MFRGNGMGKWMAIATLACAGVAMGQAQVAAPAAPTGEKAMAPTPSTPLMGLLEQAGVGQPLKDARINIFGHAEGSYTYDPSNPPNGIITGRAFDFENEQLTLNQVMIAAERQVVISPTNFDIGGRAEMMYGSDARVIHANGMNFYGSSNPQLGPENQFDLTQAYFDVAVPVGNGLRIRTGKFVTLAGYETIDPTTTPLYSRGYLFTFAVPFTQTGIYGTYAFNDQWVLDGGISRGWDQSLTDNNSVIDGLVRLTYHAPNKKNDVYVTGLFGPEDPGDNGSWRELVDVVWNYNYSDQLTFAVNGDYGHDDQGASQWYGLAGYATWKLADPVSVNGRIEWFNDVDGFRGLGTNVYDLSLGLLITPFPNDTLASNWKIRPEVRFDYAENAIFDGNTQNFQFTAAIESYFTF